MLKKILNKALDDLKGRGEAILTDSVERLKGAVEERATVIIRHGEQIAREKLAEVQKMVAEKIDPRLAELFNVKSKDDTAYSVIITDDPNHPFQVDDAIKNRAIAIARGLGDDGAKARAIFDWFVQNVNYGAQKRPDNLGYRTSNEVFTDREGVCGEMAVLYIVMARSVGLKANYVSVTKDNQDKDIVHACAAVYLGQEPTLVDPAYHAFDAKHQAFAIKTDAEAVPLLKTFRKKTGQ